MKHELATHFEPEIVYRKLPKGATARHGGAWKIAYADFVTAMMAFFMLMWIIGATDEDQRKGIADYFTPTVVQMRNSGGSNGIMGGRSLSTEDGVASRTSSDGRRSTPLASGGGGGPLEAQVASPDKATTPGQARMADETRFKMVRRIIAARVAGDPTLKGLRGQLRFVRTRDGMRIDIVERADFPMFAMASDQFTGPATRLVAIVAASVREAPNALTVRGHTDGFGYAGGGTNNWTLSTARADATRRALSAGGVGEARFRRIEGVADTDPFNPRDRLDARNRRISVTLLYSQMNMPPSR